MQKREERREGKKNNDRKKYLGIEPMPGLKVWLKEKGEKKRRRKTSALHRIEPGSTDTKGYRPLHLQ